MELKLEIGQELEGGIYVGTLDGHAIVMAPRNTIKKLNWYDAMEYCIELNVNEFSDWYLPNKEELNLIYESELTTEDFYWSSVENSNIYSWGQGFYNGRQSQSNKENSNYCVAVRKIPFRNNKPSLEIKEIRRYEYNNRVYETKQQAELAKELHKLVNKFGYDTVDQILQTV